MNHYVLISTEDAEIIFANFTITGVLIITAVISFTGGIVCHRIKFKIATKAGVKLYGYI